jgi:Peptidase C13 family
MRIVGRQILHHLGTALRALVFMRLPTDAPATGFPAVIGLVFLAVCTQAGLERLIAGSDATFDASGISAAVAAWAVFATLVQLLRRVDRPLVITNLVGTCAAVTICFSSLVAAVTLVPSLPLERLGIPADRLTADIAAAPFAVMIAAGVALIVYFVGTYWRIARAASFNMPRRLGLALPIMTLLPLALVPMRPIFLNDESAFTMPSVWDLAKLLPSSQTNKEAAQRPPAIDFEAAWARQPDLVSKALAGLAPSRPGIPEAYFVGAAAYAEQDVFKREVTSARGIVDDRLGTRDRSLLLINHRDSVVDQPLANMTNLEAVLVGIGKMMDHDKDVLVLYLTSHGGPGAFSISFSGFGFNNLTPDRLVAMLAKSGIKNRVVILSACYSGSFVPALERPDTLVMTAASADKTSFGCSNEREWTYFGDALFNHALRETTSLPEAFQLAAKTVAGWEKTQGLVASEPQMFVGSDITKTLDRLQRRLSETAKPAATTPSQGVDATVR